MASQDAEFATFDYDERYDPQQPLPYRLRSDSVVTSSIDPKSSERKYFIRAAKNGEVYEVGEEELFLASRLDGRVSFVELSTSFKARFNTDISLEPFTQFAERLVDMGVTERVPRSRFATYENDSPGSNSSDPRASMFRRSLFNPGRIFDFLTAFRVLGMVFAWLAIPLFFLASGVVLTEFTAMSAEFNLAVTSLSVLIRAPISLAIDNFLTKLVQGTVAHVNGAKVRVLGITFVLGFFPRLYISHDEILRLDRRAQMRVFFAPLLVRIMLFSFAIIMWSALEETRGSTSDFFLLLAHQSLATFVLTLMPFWPSDGYYWLAAYLDQPNLRARVFRYVGMRLRGRAAPDEMSDVDKTLSVIFAVLCVVGCIALAGTLLFYVAVGLELRLGGEGVALFGLILALTGLWLFFLRRSVGRVRERARAIRSLQAASAPIANNTVQLRGRAATEGDVVPVLRRMPSTAQRIYARPYSKPVWPRLVGLALLVAFGVVLFLPYQYKPGGDFVVLPNQHADVTSQVDGEVAQIFVKEGQWVEQGQPLVRLVNWEVARDLAVSEAALKKAQADVQRLKDGSKPEAVALAESQIKDAEASVAYRRAEMERTKALVAIGGASQRAFEAAASQYEETLAEVEVSRSNRDNVKAPPLASELTAAIANVESLQQDIAYRRGQLERLTVRAPLGGRIITPDVDLLSGKYLRIGMPIAQIDDTRTARVQVNLPEGDLRYIKVGDRVQVVSWAYSDSTVYGNVVAIGSSAQAMETDQVIRITTELPNEDGALRSQMTGFAKIEGEQMRVWKAYTLFLIRFFQVKVWSWFP